MKIIQMNYLWVTEVFRELYFNCIILGACGELEDSEEESHVLSMSESVTDTICLQFRDASKLFTCINSQWLARIEWLLCAKHLILYRSNLIFSATLLSQYWMPFFIDEESDLPKTS